MRSPQPSLQEPPLGCAWEVIYCTIELMDSVGATGAGSHTAVPLIDCVAGIAMARLPVQL